MGKEPHDHIQAVSIFQAKMKERCQKHWIPSLFLSLNNGIGRALDSLWSCVIIIFNAVTLLPLPCSYMNWLESYKKKGKSLLWRVPPIKLIRSLVVLPAPSSSSANMPRMSYFKEMVQGNVIHFLWCEWHNQDIIKKTTTNKQQQQKNLLGRAAIESSYFLDA